MDRNLLKVDDPTYQTLSDFIHHPFGVPFTDVGEKLNPKYEKFKSMISVAGYSILDDSYYIHIKVPSESSPGKFYDVVIQFMPYTETMKKEHMLDNYVIQFFSNSPSFIYKYAALYKLHGYMIDALQEKLDPEYADRLPELSNSEMKLMYDKSIYFAVKFLYENCLTYLSKSGLRYTKKLEFRNLVDSIVDNKTSLKTSAYDVEKKAIAEGKADTSKIQKEMKRLFGNRSGNNIHQKKTAVTSTFPGSSGIKHTPVKSKNTGKAKKGKVTSTTSTRRK